MNVFVRCLAVTLGYYNFLEISLKTLTFSGEFHLQVTPFNVLADLGIR